MFDIEITDHPAHRLAGIPHLGPYDQIGSAFETLGTLFTSRALWPEVQGLLGVFLDDPGTVPETELRSYACVMIGEGTAVEPPLKELRLDAGPVAVMHFKGPYAGLKAAYDHIYCNWLPTSGRALRASPCYEIYLNSPEDVAPEDLRTDICVPLD